MSRRVEIWRLLHTNMEIDAAYSASTRDGT
jgi:hypothetical protein